MLYQKLRNIYNFFFSGRKNILQTGATKNNYSETGVNTNGKVKLMYHRDFDTSAECENMKPDPMQHDWWIN